MLDSSKIHVVIGMHNDQHVCICSKGVYIGQLTDYKILVVQTAVILMNHDEIFSMTMAQ